ncbi:hypothetical protein HNP84_000745 [Thermocatellispora tengchongensis]|uniref:Uncharacterized protein n=1 Tax=Thermocatellispora tengchongensis TaxID=1073253 RepID=A0A840NW52_9ACTN|nr:hypothetical protein [Thermocatellispora tengchongensis]MBB5131039.1 hypothetical protein [Thermocatellispora tengchongensis]
MTGSPPQAAPAAAPADTAATDLHAALAARRDLGPDYEDAVVAGFLEKVEEQIERRVDARLTAARPHPARTRTQDAQALALAIVSLVLGVGGSAIALNSESNAFEGALLIWIGVIAVNAVFAFSRRRG